MSKSLAILADAAHLLSDAAGIFISLLALILSGRGPSAKMSYGFHRVEILGALCSLLLIWGITAGLVVEATKRLITPRPVDGGLMLVVSVLGILINLLMIRILHGSSAHGVTSCGALTHNHAGCHGHGPPGPVEYFLTNSADEGVEHVGAHASCRKHDEEAHAQRISPCTHAPAYESENMVDRNPMPVQSCTVHTVEQTEEGGLSECKRSCNEAGRESTQKTELKDRSHDHCTLEIGDPVMPTHLRQGNVNVRSAYLHILGDLIQSIGVAFASLIIYFKPEWSILDPLSTFFFSMIVLLTTRRLCMEVVAILVERVPHEVDLEAVASLLQKETGVIRLVDLHAWSITCDKRVLTAVMVVSNGQNRNDMIHRLRSVCSHHGLQHCTFELQNA